MSIATGIGSVVATPDEQLDLSTLFSVTPAANDPTYLIVSGLDRDEYTAGYKTSDMGSLSGGGASQTFTNVESDAWSVGIVFTYQASTGQYYNSTYGNFDQLTYAASTNTNDNVGPSVYTTGNYNLAMDYATNSYSLEQDPGNFNYAGSVSVVTQSTYVGPAPTQATPDSVCAAAASFVGKAWNMDGCWVLTSNISAEAGASLSASRSHLDLATVSDNIGAYVTVSDQGTNADLRFDPSGHGGGSLFAILANMGSAIISLADMTSHGALRFS
jgi:hypothetical protein